MAITGADFRGTNGDGLMGHEMSLCTGGSPGQIPGGGSSPLYSLRPRTPRSHGDDPMGYWVCRGHADDCHIQGATTVAT